MAKDHTKKSEKDQTSVNHDVMKNDAIQQGSSPTFEKNEMKKNRALLLSSSSTRQRGVNILRICGTPYQMGYQHGFHLAKRVETMVHKTVLALPAFMSALTGESFEVCLERARENQKASYLPKECLEEMRGIADGATDAGGANVMLENVLLWNTYYDQWCIYCHPHYSWRGSNNNKTPTTKIMNGSVGCSSFCAWDEWAGGDGKLIMGKNEDNFNMPFQEENRIMVVAQPQDGFGQIFMSYPGLIGLDGGFNQAGFQVMTQLNSMVDETMEGCGIAVFTRLLLTHVCSVQEAIRMIQKYPKCGGIAWHVVDAKNKQAAIVETSSKHVCVRYPQTRVKALWQTNHSNCYPGWEGYEGYNMVADQQLVNELENVDTIENWQASLRDATNLYVQAPSRYERYRDLIQLHKGNITPETAQAILSDCFDPYLQKERDKNEPSKTNNVLCTICALYPDMDFDAPAPLGGFKARIGNMWSMVSYPETGDFWLAVNGFPAQYGGYIHFNLNQLLMDH